MLTDPKYTIKCFRDARRYTPAEVNNMLALLHRLPSSLQFIVDAELKAGNKLEDISEGYPDEGSICACFFKRFRNNYRINDVKYAVTNDPHYWYADYSTIDIPRHLLVCNW